MGQPTALQAVPDHMVQQEQVLAAALDLGLLNPVLRLPKLSSQYQAPDHHRPLLREVLKRSPAQDLKEQVFTLRQAGDIHRPADVFPPAL